MSPSRIFRVVAARNEAIYQIKAAHPNLSFPQLGKWFRKDHTSIIHSLARHAEANSLPSLTRYDIHAVDERNRLSAAKSRATKD
jgi:chromosomal replication initiation ATPase DnaA